jgi:hypothetical protein
MHPFIHGHHPHPPLGLVCVYYPTRSFHTSNRVVPETKQTDILAEVAVYASLFHQLGPSPYGTKELLIKHLAAV